LPNVEFLSQFDEDAVDRIVIVRVVPSSGGKVKDYEVIFGFGLDELLMVLKPLNEECFLPNTAFCLDY
jgi:hypothetical protein